MKIPSTILLAAEKAIEAVLNMDPETRQRLAQLDGKTVRVNLDAPPVSLLLMVVDGQVHLDHPDDDNADTERADTTISGSFLALRSLLDGNEAIYNRQVSIEGDIGTSAQLKQIAQQLDPDWQDTLSPYLGDALTHRLDVKHTEFMRWFARVRHAAGHNTSEYLQEEAQWLAPNELTRQFCQDIDDVRAAADRLAARVQRLEMFNESQ